MTTILCGYNGSPAAGATAPQSLSQTFSKADYAASGSTISAVHLVASGDTLTLITAYGRTNTSGVPAAGKLAVYITNAGGTTHGAKVTGNYTTATTLVFGSGAEERNTAPISFDLTPWAGQYIKLAYGYDVQWRRGVAAIGSGSVTATADLADPYGTATSNNFTPTMWMTIDRPAARSINSTNSGTNDLNAGAVNTASVTGYVVGVNPVVSGTVGSLALTSVSQATTIATFTIQEPVNNSYYPQPDTSHTLTLTDGSNPTTFNAVMNSLAGYTSIVLASPDLADTHKIPYWLTSTAVNDDRIMYKTADMTVAADGGISGATLGATTIYYHWRVADSKIYAYEALLSEDGIATSTGLTVRGLSVSGPSVRGLTVRGI